MKRKLLESKLYTKYIPKTENNEKMTNFKFLKKLYSDKFLK